MGSRGPVLKIHPGQKLEIIFWADAEIVGEMPLHVHLGFAPELRATPRKIETSLSSAKRDKTQRATLKIRSDVKWSGLIHFGILTVRSRNRELAWQELPKAEIVSDTHLSTPFLGIRLRVRDPCKVEYSIEE